ncbi:cobaltochelatase subunit CobN [Candidatus Endobugula sertula]|uniref:Cobaltochelatase subunit CobN n=1 Tax=Candidatus Endobugula sertula TaxID=62101 RepID=A0A1D2QNI0_9GAMM|nr:cobaltochelatase subunit CobN [Candidatus Endobugula sertula]
MHLLASHPGGFSDDEGIVDLDQSPADVILLSAADSALAALAESAEWLPKDFPSIRLANWMHLSKPAAFDLYRHKVLDHSVVVVLSLLGGRAYWPYGFEQLQDWAQHPQHHLVIVPGDDTVDDDLLNASSVSYATASKIWQFLRQGGALNNQQLFYFLASELLGRSYSWNEPQILPAGMLYLPDSSLKYSQVSFHDCQQRWLQRPQAPICVLLFYRSHLQSANTAMFDQLITQLEAQGLNLLPIAITSLKNQVSLSLVNSLLLQTRQLQAKQKSIPASSQPSLLIINTTSFASHTVSCPDLAAEPSEFSSPFIVDVPVLQLLLSSSTEEDWQQYPQGLRSRDIAMQVVLPEMDGRIITRAISFKREAWFSERCEVPVVRYSLHRERTQFVAELARRYCRLAAVPNQQKRIALILANYPTKDGRIGNGVGLDTPASTINILKALKEQGYPISDIPDNGTMLVKSLLESITNNPNTLHHLPCWQSLSLSEYQEYFACLPIDCQQAVLEKWGSPESDPKYRHGRLMLAGIRLGETFIGIQPARGFDRDLVANYHDPDLIPPHSYLAFYFWLRHSYQVDAFIHVGKHGNLEWLPGKGNALSDSCWPDIALGPMPHFYPFIVNDPGEGAQAKRRTQAVIIDHLMPPITRAETYGELAELESLVDEYYQAMGLDQRRADWLKQKILDIANHSHVLNELNSVERQDHDKVLAELDAYLCDIKEAQIRHGLHILGELPKHHKLVDSIMALLRLPRGGGECAQGILHNLARDLHLHDFDPLLASSKLWNGAQPEVLKSLSELPWRTEADTRERLELFALELIDKYIFNLDINILTDNPDKLLKLIPATCKQLLYVKNNLLHALKKSAEQEIQALIDGLNGGFIDPGPSGAPTRGRLDTLPTGRNFFSVDNRSIPSPAACAIGEKSAQQLIERHLQEHGDYPKQLGLSVWGTATMRTGGDDIAQAFALMGIKPIRAEGSQRVIDIEIIPAMLLGRPRIDVTLRVSGFFRDAFPNVMRLYDAAIQALSMYDEPGTDNTIQQNIRARVQVLEAQGLSPEKAYRQASYRVFGSKPGAYGVGLQGLIDERCWETGEDLAEAYVNWGGYAYGQGEAGNGVIAKEAFQYQLSRLDVVIHNQDNREHDVLDSDDYYQFQGGMSNAVSIFSQQAPAIYHNDHSNPAVPKIRTLKEELNRVIRSRVLNPKWIHAMQEHGYKGAFEMAASVDYLFAYDATTHLIDDYQYQQIADQLIFDLENQGFLREHNLNALEEMVDRLLEATQRGMWNKHSDYPEKLQNLLLNIDAEKEAS